MPNSVATQPRPDAPPVLGLPPPVSRLNWGTVPVQNARSISRRSWVDGEGKGQVKNRERGTSATVSGQEFRLRVFVAAASSGLGLRLRRARSGARFSLRLPLPCAGGGGPGSGRRAGGDPVPGFGRGRLGKLPKLGREVAGPRRVLPAARPVHDGSSMAAHLSLTQVPPAGLRAGRGAPHRCPLARLPLPAGSGAWRLRGGRAVCVCGGAGDRSQGLGLSRSRRAEAGGGAASTPLGSGSALPGGPPWRRGFVCPPPPPPLSPAPPR